MGVLRTLVFFISALAATAGAAESAPTPLAAPVLTVAKSFEAKLVHLVPRATAGSWVSLAADPRGRLYASDQYGPIYRITLPAANAAEDGPVVTPLALPIGGAHGLSWINGSLYVVVGQKAVCATGLYRVRDTDGDGELDKVELLRVLDGDGEHGPHTVVASPDGQSLYVMAGNGTRLPELAGARVPRLWREDSLLAPLPALMGSETRGMLPGGWICRTDLDGRAWELHAVGFRNAYGLALDNRGELFTFDSDTEFEINLPWYRPTRVIHAVSGADFGWRGGALKVPETAPDTWPIVLPMGLGSPTAVTFAAGAKFPVAYQRALWIADWSYGKLYALRLTPQGSTFAAAAEEIVSGLPLPITAVCVNPLDGSLYFTTGGRRLPSALYRLRWTGSTENEKPVADSPNPAAILRRSLEAYHGREDARAVAEIWPALDHADGFVRKAARVVLESQPVSTWRTRAVEERVPRVALAALLALARADAASSQTDILLALQKLDEAPLPPPLRGEWLRVLSLSFSRGEAPSASVRATWGERLGKLFPTADAESDATLLELLVFCEAPGVAANGISALRHAVTRQQQLALAKSLRVLRNDWTPELRREYFEWLAQTFSWRGGGTFARFLQRLRDDSVAAAPENERPALRQLLAAAAKTNVTPDYRLSAERPVVREWTTDDLTALAQNDRQKRDASSGRKIFGAVGCFGCHTFDGEGGALGPDLTAIARRMSVRDLFEAIVEPSRAISDQYGTVDVKTRDGRQFSGRIVNLTENGLQLAENLAEPNNVIRLAENDIVTIEPSRHSLMPAGLLNVLSSEEILDLLAFIQHPAPSARR